MVLLLGCPPVPVEAGLAQQFNGQAATDGTLRRDHDPLPQALGQLLAELAGSAINSLILKTFMKRGTYSRS